MFSKHAALRGRACGRLHCELAPGRHDVEVGHLGLRHVISELAENCPEVELPKALIEMLVLELLHEVRIARRQPRPELLKYGASRCAARSIQQKLEVRA